MTPEGHKVEKSGRGVSFLAMFACLVALIAIGSLVAYLLGGGVKVVVAERAIPAFTRIAAEDLTTISKSRADHDQAISDVDQLVGKVAATTISEDEEVDDQDVIDLEGDIGEVQIQIHPARAEALGLTPGDRVRLWLAPTEEAGKAASVCAVLLAIPDSESDAEQTYVVGVSRREAPTLVERLGRSRVVISRLG